jgi:hypothetical protein
MDDIRIIRLQCGEDIIANYNYNDETTEIVLSDPMTILFKRLPTGKAFMMMSPWLPIELIEDNVAIMFENDILTAVKPKQSVITYYKRIVNESTIESLQSYSEIESALLNNDNEAYYEDIDEDEIEEYMESIESKEQLLH